MTTPTSDPTILLVWIDLETTGLDKVIDPPLEVAMVITDLELQEIDPSLRFHCYLQMTDHAESQLASSEFVTEMHTKNDLLDDIEKAMQKNQAFDMNEADVYLMQTLSEAEDKVDADEVVFYLAGSGVAAFDRDVIETWFPKFYEKLNYRTIDVGQIRRFIEHVVGLDLEGLIEKADENHRARSDVQNAIEQTLKIRDFLRDAFELLAAAGDLAPAHEQEF